MRSSTWAVLAGATGAAVAAWAVRGRSSAVFGPSVWRANPGRKAIALTFDDGPSESTPAVLECLSRHGARATFFQCGQNVLRLPAAARQVIAAGHEIGNHSHTHPDFALQSTAFIHDEFARGQQAIASVTGTEPRLMRAPYGVRWLGFREMQSSLGLLGVMWTVIGLDWKLDAAAIAARVRRHIQPGAIVCLHDGRTTKARPDITPVLKALPLIVSYLSENGYHLETVSQLLCPTTN